MDAHAIPVLLKTLKVVDALAGAGATTQELSRGLGIAPSTCFRILRTLSAADWVVGAPDGKWALSAGLARLVDTQFPSADLRRAARAPMQALAVETGLSTKLSVREADHAVTLVRADAPSGMSVTGRVGSRFPLAFGSSGAVLLADESDEGVTRIWTDAPDAARRHQTKAEFLKRLKQARAGGRAVVVDQGSYSPHVATLSVAVRSAEGRVLAALTLLGTPDVMSARLVPRLGKALQATAGVIERQLNVRAGSGGDHA